MVSTLVWNARDVGSIPILGVVSPIFLTPNDSICRPATDYHKDLGHSLKVGTTYLVIMYTYLVIMYTYLVIMLWWRLFYIYIFHGNSNSYCCLCGLSVLLNTSCIE